ncbi:MAG: DUF502 domain-containing protein [Verrucomicrobiae bacterium]|nr:DUF502 domain-containing protein [Verrucomicrobiae bacterium]
MSEKAHTWRGDFYAGVAIVLPVAVSLVIFEWLLGAVSNAASTLLFFLPWVLDREFIYVNGRSGQMFWHWKVAATVLLVALVWLTGHLGRDFLGRKAIAAVDAILLRVPVLNTIHGVVKQVNDAFRSTHGRSFKQVVLVEFPRKGVYSLGFVTGADQQEVQHRTQEKVLSVFVPTTPNPTSGYLVMVPENQVRVLDMTVTDGIKYIISLGSVTPPWQPALPGGAGTLVAPANGEAPGVLEGGSGREEEGSTVTVVEAR